MRCMHDARVIIRICLSPPQIVLGLVQVLQLLGSSLQLSIPSPFLEIKTWFGWVTLDLFSVVNLQCLYAYTFIDKFVLRALFPVALIGLINLLARHSANRTMEEDDPDLRAVFDAVDSDKSGTLDANELALVVSAPGFEHKGVLLSAESSPSKLGPTKPEYVHCFRFQRMRKCACLFC